MAKHGKNTASNPIYTNYERRRDAKESGFGTQTLRLDKNSSRRLDQCALTNQKSEENKMKSPAFWLKTDSNIDNKIIVKPSKPDNVVLCPITKKPLKISELVDIYFNLANDKKTHLCPISGDVINHSVPCVVLKCCGKILTKQYVDRFIKKEGDSFMLCPLCGIKLIESDLIVVKIGGSSFSSSNSQLVAKISKPVLSAT